MALKHLPTKTMLHISDGFLEPERRRLLESIDGVKNLIPLIIANRQDLLQSGKPADTSKLDKAIAANRTAADAMDVRHDRKSRGAYTLLGALADLSEDPDVAAHLLDLRDRMMPLGLSIVQLSYAEEAGNARQVRHTLDDTMLGALKKVKTVEGRTLADEVQAWLDAGDELGKLENERLVLEQKRDGQDKPSSPANVQKSRNRWIRLINALISNLALAEIDAETEKFLLGRLREEEAKADRRMASRKTADDTNGGEDTTGTTSPK